MLQLLSQIYITQVSSDKFKNRNKTYGMTFVTECEIVSSWANLTDTARLKFPKKIYFNDETGKKVSWEGKNVTGDSATPPLLMRGDKIIIQLGYKYPIATTSSSPDAIDTQVKEMNIEFAGYVSKVTPSQPIEIECEDNMFLLKGIQVPDKTYNGTLLEMLNDLFASARKK